MSTEEVQNIVPEAEVLPPVRRGDLPRAIEDGVHVAVIVDGRFHQSKSVSVSEIVDCLRAGMTVYGCSSIGAMRAVECREWGMIGCGAIFEHLLETPYFRDDYLAQSLDPETFKAFSVPFIESLVRMGKLRAQKLIREDDAELVLELLEGCHYPQRTEASLRGMLRKRDVDPKRASELARLVFAEVRQKFDDAELTLKKVRLDLESHRECRTALVGRSAPSLEPFYA